MILPRLLLLASLTCSALHAQTAADVTPAALAGKTVTCTITGGNAPFESAGTFELQLGTPTAGQYTIPVSSGNTTARTGTYTTISGPDFINIRLNGYIANGQTVEIELFPIGNGTATAVSGPGKTYFEMYGGPANKRGTFTIGGVSSGGGATGPTITSQPVNENIISGNSVGFVVAASGPGLTYQWRFNGTAIAGATSSIYTIAFVSAAHAGTYAVAVTNSSGTTVSNSVTLTVTGGTTGGGSAGAYLTNLSIRSNAGAGPQTLIVGVSIGGTATNGTKNILIRGIGPALTGFGVTTPLADPRLEVFSGAAVIATNDNWDAAATPLATQTGTGAFPLTAGSRDAALIGAGVPSGTYSVQLTGAGGTTGIALAEIYDLTPAAGFTATTPRLVNISARTQVGTGGDILITGFNVGGTGTRRLLIRGVGPTLGVFGLTGTLVDPKLEIYNSANTLVGSNDNWDAAATPNATQIAAGGFALNASSRDAAIIVTLAPGTYTAQVSGVGGTTGIGLVEIYELP